MWNLPDLGHNTLQPPTQSSSPELTTLKHWGALGLPALASISLSLLSPPLWGAGSSGWRRPSSTLARSRHPRSWPPCSHPNPTEGALEPEGSPERGPLGDPAVSFPCSSSPITAPEQMLLRRF